MDKHLCWLSRLVYRAVSQGTIRFNLFEEAKYEAVERKPRFLSKRQFDVRKSQWICFLINGKRPKNVGIMLEKVANYLYLSS
ncbi:hypothetical protein PGIN_11A_01342 [Porphyromonas gingivalis]|nr:hypothetical protein PGIN_11A_01342 [Porphyromonas gingivalis]